MKLTLEFERRGVLGDTARWDDWERTFQAGVQYGEMRSEMRVRRERSDATSKQGE